MSVCNRCSRLMNVLVSPVPMKDGESEVLCDECLAVCEQNGLTAKGIQITATYSPEDNKLRLYASERLDAVTFEKVKAAGFRWAPMQKLFVAPAWTPEREDLCIELAGEVGDEDTTLADRAEAKAERLDKLSDKRESEAVAAKDRAAEISSHIPFGQPILIGHHSEKRARRDAEKIQSSMTKAVRLWDEAEYWKRRAAGALANAKYKELPSVRARRIKGLEADKRKQERYLSGYEESLAFWQDESKTREECITWAQARGGSVYITPEMVAKLNPDPSKPLPERPAFNVHAGLVKGIFTVEYVRAARLESLPKAMERPQRWRDHFANRIAYEKAMMGESGGIPTDRTKPEVGGAVKCWASGTNGRWLFIVKVNPKSVSVLDTWDNENHDGTNRDGQPCKYFRRVMPFDKVTACISKTQVEAARADGTLVGETKRGFFLTSDPLPPERKPKEADPVAGEFAAMKKGLRDGVAVTVVSADQLFPTPPELADRVAEEAGADDGLRILEPSAGTGNLMRAVYGRCRPREFLAVEINPKLAKALEGEFIDAKVVCDDFLTLSPDDIGFFDVVVMNPPFADGTDIKHIEHARKFLAPGGRLVAICANGPRQRNMYGEGADYFEELTAGTFKSSGTNVNTALVHLSREA